MPLSVVLSSFRFSRHVRYNASAACAALLLLAACTHGEDKPVTMTEVRAEMAAEHNFDAFLHLRDLAAQGNPEAQYELGYFYRNGTVGAADFTKARTWYLRAANQGDANAMIELAAMNGLGQGGPVDLKETVKWLTIAGNTHKLTPDVAAAAEGNRAKYADGLSSADLATVTSEVQAFQPRPESLSPIISPGS